MAQGRIVVAADARGALVAMADHIAEAAGEAAGLAHDAGAAGHLVAVFPQLAAALALRADLAVVARQRGHARLVVGVAPGVALALHAAHRDIRFDLQQRHRGSAAVTLEAVGKDRVAAGIGRRFQADRVDIHHRLRAGDIRLQVDAVIAAVVGQRRLGQVDQHFAPLPGDDGAARDVAVQLATRERGGVAAGVGGLQEDPQLLPAAGAAMHEEAHHRMRRGGVIGADIGQADGVEVAAGERNRRRARMHRRRVGEVRRRGAEGKVQKTVLQRVVVDHHRLAGGEAGQCQQHRHHSLAQTHGLPPVLGRRNGVSRPSVRLRQHARDCAIARLCDRAHRAGPGRHRLKAGTGTPPRCRRRARGRGGRRVPARVSSARLRGR